MVTMQEISEALSVHGSAETIMLPQPDSAVRWVASSELPHPKPFLEGGELVLTNGLFASKGMKWNEYVAGLVEAGAVGLGLGLGVGIDEIPDGLRKACRRQRMNLLRLPGHVAFVSVSRMVAGMLYDGAGDPGQDHAVLLAQQELGRAAATGSRQAIVHTLASLLQATVAVHDSAGALLEGPVGADPETLPLEEIRHEIGRVWHRGMYGFIDMVESGHNLELIPLGVTGTPVAYLAVMHADRFVSWQRSARDLAASLLGIEARSRYQQQDFEQRIRSLATNLLLDGHVCASATLTAEFGGPSLGQTAQIAVVSGGNVTGMGQSALVSVAPERETIVVADPATIAALPESLSDSARIGIGGVTPLKSLGTSLSQARRALAKTSAKRRVVSWQELATRSVSTWLDANQAELFVRQQLGELRYDSRMVETLRAYLLAGGSTTGAAQMLGVHRNTVGYRMSRLRAELGDLDSPSRRANLWVALEIAGDSSALP